MQDFKVKPSTNHRANVLGQLPPVIMYMYIVLTEDVVYKFININHHPFILNFCSTKLVP